MSEAKRKYIAGSSSVLCIEKLRGIGFNTNPVRMALQAGEIKVNALPRTVERIEDMARERCEGARIVSSFANFHSVRFGGRRGEQERKGRGLSFFVICRKASTYAAISSSYTDAFSASFFVGCAAFIRPVYVLGKKNRRAWDS